MKSNVAKSITANINAKSVLAYLFLPQLGRRIKALSINTRWIALLIARIFEVMRLLPAEQSAKLYNNSENLKITEVMAAAGNNIKFDLKHSDQIIIYGTILLGLVLLVAQFALLAFVITTNMAHAQFSGFFSQPTGLPADKDIAFSMLDQVFGVPGLFGTSYDPDVMGATPAFTIAVQATFYTYNKAMTLVAAFLVIYFIFVIIVETVQEGTPFGKRFASGYVPLRLIIALAFLVPTYHGYSTGQHLVLRAAKWGGHFATNSWVIFGSAVENPIGMSDDKVLPDIKAPSVTAFAEFMVLAQICNVYYRTQYHKENVDSGLYYAPPPVTVSDAGVVTVENNVEDNVKNPAGKPRPINLYAIYDTLTAEGNARPVIMAEIPPRQVRYYTSYPPGPTISDQKTFVDATQGRNVRIRFGKIHPDFKGYLGTNGKVIAYGAPAVSGSTPPAEGKIKPLCGEIMIPAAANPYPDATGVDSAAGLMKVMNLIGVFLAWYDDRFTKIGYRLLAIEGALTVDGAPVDPCDIPFSAFDETAWGPCDKYPKPGYYQTMIDDYLVTTMNGTHAATIPMAETEVRNLLISHTLFAGVGSNSNAELFAYGWAGAGMWYNRISDTYSAYKEALKGPVVRAYPMILNEVAEAKRNLQPNAKGVDIFDPKVAEAGIIKLENPADLVLAKILSRIIFDMKAAGLDNNALKADKSKSFANFINIIFGLEGIFNLRANGDVHPFGQLVAAGKGLIDSSVAAFMGTIFATGISGFLDSIGEETGSGIGKMATEMSSMAATIGLTAGIIMFYVIPMTPFMYFFLAAGRWVKSIFEAMIAVPLWAMAHLRIDGTGLPGVAGNGYFLVFEIFLRPFLTLMGLLASIATYAALMTVMHDVFDLVVDNMANNQMGAAPDDGGDYIDSYRGVVDMYFYTILYAIIAYMMAMASFKLIDLIPDSILRWMGAGVKSFGDESGNIAENLNQTIAIQGAMTAKTVGSVAEGLGGALGGGAGGLKKIMSRR